jgi:hypothetical protein
MFGGVSVAADTGALEGVRFLISLAQLITDRDAVAAQLRELGDAAKQHNAALEELKKREQQVLHREQQATKTAEALAKREAAVAEQEQKAQLERQRAEEKVGELTAMKAEMKQWAAVAA